MSDTWVQTVVDETWSQTVLVEEWTFTGYPSVSWEVLTGTVTIDGGGGGGVSLASSAPADVGTTAAVGTGTTAARSDHVHRVVTNTANGLVRLNAEGTIPPILIDETIARDSEVTAAISAHAGATDPHGDRSFTTSAISTHAAATDPHGDRAYTDSAVSGRVPTTRTLAGLDLTTDRDAAALRTALGLVLGTDVQAYSAELAAIALLTTTSFGRSLLAATDGPGVRDIIDAAPDGIFMIPDASYSGTRTNYGTPMHRASLSVTNTAIAAGAMYLAKGCLMAGSAPGFLTFTTSASALTAGQSIFIVCYNVSTTDGMPSTLAWSQSVTVGTTVGSIQTAVSSKVIPSNGYFIGVHNPSTNAGAVTINAGATDDYLFGVGTSFRGQMNATSQGATPSSDVSAYTAAAAAGATAFAPVATCPIVLAR